MKEELDQILLEFFKSRHRKFETLDKVLSKMLDNSEEVEKATKEKEIDNQINQNEDELY